MSQSQWPSGAVTSSLASKQEAYRSAVLAIPEDQIAWFSGWLCADGCITVDSTSRNKRFKLQFKICDQDPLHKFSAMFGGSVGGPVAPTGLGKKPTYNWSVQGWRAATILERCRPWLSDRYAARADAVMGGFSAKNHHGQKLTPAVVANIKAELAAGENGVSRRLAQRYGVSDGMISAIKSGRLWGYVTPTHRPPNPWPSGPVYIAGKMRGLDGMGFKAFYEAEATLRGAGLRDVFNPARHDTEVLGVSPEGKTAVAGDECGGDHIRAAMLADMQYICSRAEWVCVLPGWNSSRGAVAEVATAVAIGIPVFEYETGMEIRPSFTLEL